MKIPKTLMLFEPRNGATHARRRYSIAIRRLRGRSGDVTYHTRSIRLAPGSERTQVHTLIHEAIHVSNPDIDEDAINRAEWNVVAVLDACLKGQKWPPR